MDISNRYCTLNMYIENSKITFKLKPLKLNPRSNYHICKSTSRLRKTQHSHLFTDMANKYSYYL